MNGHMTSFRSAVLVLSMILCSACVGDERDPAESGQQKTGQPDQGSSDQEGSADPGTDQPPPGDPTPDEPAPVDPDETEADTACQARFEPSAICSESADECTFYVGLDGASCADYCAARGAECLAAETDLDDGCAVEGPSACDEPAFDGICTCSMDSECADRYQPELVCGQEPESCTFFALLDGSSCSEHCAARGGECLAAAKDLDDGCSVEEETDCDESGHDFICTCSL